MERIKHLIDPWYGCGAKAATKEHIAGGARCLESNITECKRTGYEEQTQNIGREHEQNEPFGTSPYCTEAELVLERLPYITKVKKADLSSGRLCDLATITQFHGINVPEDEEFDGGLSNSAVPSVAYSRALPAMEQFGIEVPQEAFKGLVPVEQVVDRLYLSDDDIEDL